ncbi:cache domain-containing protein [Desulfobacterales bacterium HSG16]|nr:cache domain-containing protein [Desulfobacterales bacterium HSG16]
MNEKRNGINASIRRWITFSRSFQFRIFSALVIVIIIFIPAVGYISYLTGRKAVEGQIERHAVSTASHISRQIQAFLARHSSNARLIKSVMESRLINTLDEENLVKYFHMLKRDHPEFMNINYGDKYGNFIMVPPQRPEVYKLFDPRIRPWYKKSVEKGDLYWTGVYVFTSSQKPGITAALPISDPAGNILGVCGIDISMSAFSKFLKNLEIGRQGIAYIMENGQGRLIAHPELARYDWNPDMIRVFTTSINRLRSEKKVFGTSRYKGRKYFTSYADYPENNWTVGVLLPAREFLEEINEVKKNTSTLVFIAVLLSICLSYLLARAIVRPLKTLEQGITRIKEGDLDHTVDVADSPVIGSLARAFNNMASSLKRSRKELKQTVINLAEKEKMADLGQLTAGIAHEIKNPLGIILGSAQVAANPNRPSAMREKAICFIIDETICLDKKLRGFLAFAKPDEPQFVKTDLNELIEKTVDSMREQIVAQGIFISKKLVKQKVFSAADPGQMKQVFLNLFINAVQAMPESGEFMISTKLICNESVKQKLAQKNLMSLPYLPDAMLEIKIADTGCGIEKEAIDRIFAPFVTFKIDGTGLGLSIVLQIIKLHQAEIKVVSEPEKGTIFIIDFPCFTEEAK